jgi:hypothetical protein
MRQASRKPFHPQEPGNQGARVAAPRFRGGLTHRPGGAVLSRTATRKGRIMDLVSRFLDFNKLMGASLVRIVYYLGIVGILLSVVGGFLAALGTLFINFLAGIGMLIAVPIGGLIALCLLRFACELYIVLFKMGEDISAIRATGGLLPPKTPPV